MIQLGLFAKFWQPGTVKTRLAVATGNEEACRLYRSFVMHLLQRLENVGDHRMVVFSPAQKASDFRREVSDSWGLIPQAEGDLGVRMRTFIEERFEYAETSRSSNNIVVIIGGDCPLLGAEQILKAVELLDSSQVVLGPSTDGGYFLIAMKDRCFNVFDEIDWSTEAVLKQTIVQLESANIEYDLLEPMTDVDEIETLMELGHELQNKNQLDTLDSELLMSVQRAIAKSQTGAS